MDSKLILAAARGTVRAGLATESSASVAVCQDRRAWNIITWICAGQDTPSRADTDRRPSSAGPPLGPLLVQKFRQIKHDHYVEANQTGVEDGCVVGKVLNFQG
jgi:hypothetical protein